MYNWRNMTNEQREEILNLRKSQKFPWHSPLHLQGDSSQFHITAACYEHKPIIGYSPERMSDFGEQFCEVVIKRSEKVYAWVVLPNHYHALVKTSGVLDLLKQIHKLHGKTSYYWNGEEGKRGRRVWCNVLETAIKSERHFWATLNYIYHNPVKHEYVTKWTDWDFSNAADYIESEGREKVLNRWKEYDISEMGKGWDEF